MLAVACLLALLAYTQESGRRTDPPDRPPRENGGGGRTPDPLPVLDGSAGQKGLDAFVAACAARGDPAVAGLLALLRKGDDKTFAPRWVFVGGRLKGHPTLRAACIEALRAIPGDGATAALAEVLGATKSVEETYLLSLALEERGEVSWVPTLLDRIPAETSPTLLPVQRGMVELAARTDPAETSTRVLEGAPRGEDGSDPRTLSWALQAMPIATATETARTLLLDKGITPRAKSRYLRSILERPEVEVVTLLQEVVDARTLDETARIELAYAAAGSNGFRHDAVASRTALANGDVAEAKRMSDRFRLRMEQTTRLLNTVLDLDIGTSDDPRAVSIRKRLEAHRKFFDEG